MVYFRTNTLLCTLLKQFLPFRIIHMQLNFQWATLLLNKKKKNEIGMVGMLQRNSYFKSTLSAS